MSWVNLNDVYVNKTGDTIAGDLSVGGALTINDGKGTDTTYNVANEITTLRDSVSQSEWKVIKGNMDTNHLAYKICNGICYLSIDCGGDWGVKINAKTTTDIITMPDEALPSAYMASAACYPKDGNLSVVFGVVVSRDTKKLSVRNSSDRSTNYYAVDFCYSVKN